LLSGNKLFSKCIVIEKHPSQAEIPAQGQPLRTPPRAFS
jgi:hypothetical protein